MLRKLLIICVFMGVGFFSYSQTVVEPTGPAEWSKEYQPFRIVGNIYYVGTYDLACYLITTPEGHILINTGLASSGAMIKKNIEKLGFKFSDLKILLTTQAHHDHVGAMASIQKLTGAAIAINEKDAAVLSDGGKSDYAFGGDTCIFQPVKASRLLRNRDLIELGGTAITMLHHPGHTKGSSSFLLDVKDAGKTYRVLIVNLPSIVVSKPFSEIKTYPSIQKDYATTFDSLKVLSFDIWLSSHASQFDLHKKHKPGAPYNPSVFIDRSGYDTAVGKLEKQYLLRVKGN